MNIEELILLLGRDIDEKSEAICDLTADILESLLTIRVNSQEISYLKSLHEKMIKILDTTEKAYNEEDAILQPEDQ